VIKTTGGTGFKRLREAYRLACDPAMICEKCLLIFKESTLVNHSELAKDFITLNSGFHHDKGEDLYMWAMRGCHICSCLVRGLPEQVVKNISALGLLKGCITFELFSSTRDGDKLTLSFRYGAALDKKPTAFDSGTLKRLERGHRFSLHPISG
jgi:hypothetical protein